VSDIAKPWEVELATTDSDRRLKQNNRVARVLRLYFLLKQRIPRNVKQLAIENECSERTVYRDLDALQLAGIYCEFCKKTKSLELLNEEPTL